MTVTTAQGIAWLLGLAVPLATDLATKSAAPRWLKAGVATVLAALAGVLPTIVITDTTRWQDYVWAVLGALAVALSSHTTGLSDGVQRATAGFGLGPSAPAAAVDTPAPVDAETPPPPPPVDADA